MDASRSCCAEVARAKLRVSPEMALSRVLTIPSMSHLLDGPGSAVSVRYRTYVRMSRHFLCGPECGARHSLGSFLRLGIKRWSRPWRGMDADRPEADGSGSRRPGDGCG